MVNSTANIVAGRPKATGGAYGAPLGSTLPTDATAALDPAFKSYGYVGDAGVVKNPNRTTTTVKAWGGDTVAVLQTDYTETFDVSFIETLNPDVAKAVHGDGNVTATAFSATAPIHGNQLAIKSNSSLLAKQVFDFEVGDGIVTERIVIPNGQIISQGAVTYSDAAIKAYTVTIQAFPDSSGNCSYTYTDDGRQTA